MPAFRLLDWERPPDLVEAPVPEPGPGQVLVRVAACGLCHSDLTMPAIPAEVGAGMDWRVPFTLGHEAAGWIDAVGPGVDPGPGLGEGSAVAVSSPSSCGACRWCRRGQENACPHGLVGRGYGRDGSLAAYVLVDDPARALVALGDVDPVLAAPLTDAGATSHHAVRRVIGRVDPDGTAVVIGVGGLGAFVVQILRASTTARIVAVEPNPERRARALELGADEVVDGGSARDVVRAVRGIAGADGVDAVIDLVGTDDTIDAGVGVLAAGGALALVGAGGGRLTRPWFHSLPRDGELCTFQGSDRADLEAVVALAGAGALRVEVERYALADVAAAYAALDAGSLVGRAVVVP